MTQALYAHMNNKTIKKLKLKLKNQKQVSHSEKKKKKERGQAFIFPLHYCLYLSQIGRAASCRPEVCHKSLAVDLETLPTFCVPIVPVGSVQRKMIINQVQQVRPLSPGTFFLASVRIRSRSLVVNRVLRSC
jgi:hypothetical protein